MSIMTDERLRKVDSPNMALSWDLYVEVVEALKAERAKVAELQEWNTAMVKKAASGGALDGYRELGQRCADAEKRAEAAEAQLTALPKWAQSSESKGQFYRKSIQEMAALREQLAALREGLDGLPQYSWSVSGMVTAYFDPRYVRFDQLQSLLTQTAPPVNSAGAVTGGEDSETPQQFTASLIEKRGEHFAARVMEALEDAL